MLERDKLLRALLFENDNCIETLGHCRLKFMGIKQIEISTLGHVKVLLREYASNPYGILRF